MLQRTIQREFLAPPQPGPDALQLTLLAEIVAAKEFSHSRLYVEYSLQYDPEIWTLDQVGEGKENDSAAVRGLLKVYYLYRLHSCMPSVC